MIRFFVYISMLIFIALMSSCGVRRFLPKDEKLYNGKIIRVARDTGVHEKNAFFRKSLSGIALPKRNKMILGMPYKVWWWYVIGEPKRQKGFKYWLRNKLGEPPVLSSSVRVKANADNMTAYLENEGFFRSMVTGDTVNKGYKFKTVYEATIAHPYYISLIQWKVDSSTFGKEIAALPPKKSMIKPNTRFDLDDIKSERERVDLVLKNKGYYFFNPEYVKAYADTNHKNYTTAIYLGLSSEAPLKATIPQTIKNIVVFPNYTLLKPPPDTSLANLKMYDGIYIRDTVKAFKPSVFARTIIFRPGDTYSLSDHNKTLNRFINLGTFKFVKNRFEQAVQSDTANTLNAYYYLTPYKRKTIQFEIGGFSKTNSFTGGQVNINWRNRNFLGSAENFNAKTYGAFEVSLSDSLKKNNNWRAGAEVSLVLPRFFVPFRTSDKNSFPPKTRFVIGYEWLRRQALYTKNFFRFQYEISWKENNNKEHTVAPISITFNNTKNFTQEYLDQVALTPSLKYVNFAEIITSAFHNYVSTSAFSNGRNIYYLNTNVELAGNIYGLFNGSNAPYASKIFSGYFAQYVKADADVRYTRKLSKDLYWANRLIIGLGYPYGNSLFLPFSRQFIVGGANSLRGFRPRGIGPGTAKTTAIQQGYYPQIGGDYKLEINTELRVPIWGKLKGALFVDAGNIWTKDTVLYGPAGKLTKDFLKELGVDAGVGVRLDINVLVIRLDMAFPLKKPWLPEKERWVSKQIQFGKSAWRKDNLILNLAIGYPF